MTKRIQKLLLGAAALAALALGGSVFASAQSSPPAPAASESTAGPDTDNVQSGDQSTPDKPDSGSATAASSSRKARKAHKAHKAKHSARTHRAVARQQAGGEAQGSENPETPGTESESAANSDGPGGHADEPGNPNADHQDPGAE